MNSTEHPADPEAQWSAAAGFQRAILDSANFSIISADKEGVIRFFNAGAEKLLGYKAAEVVGKCTPTIIHVAAEVEKRAQELTLELGREISPGFETFIAKAASGVEDRREWTYLRKDGSRVPVELSVTAIRSEDGTPSGFLGIAADITDRKRQEHELRTLSLVAERTDNAIVLTDASGRVTWLNRGFQRITGYTLADMLGKSPGSVLQGPNTDPATIEHMRRQVAKGEGFSVEILNYAKSGTPYWLAVEVQPIRNNDGVLTNFMAIESNITEKKLASSRLAEAEERWSFALEGGGDGVWDWDVQSGKVLFTERVKTMLGFSASEMNGGIEQWKSMIHPEDSKRVLEDVQRCLRRETPDFAAEYRLRCKDGSWKWILDRGKVVARSEDGSPKRMVGTHSDISQRKEDEQKLHTTMAELDLFNRLMVNRELRVIELKRQVNQLLLELDRPAAFTSVNDGENVESPGLQPSPAL